MTTPPQPEEGHDDYLEMYEQLRQAHSIIKALSESNDNLMKTAIDGVHAALYMAEHRTMELYDK